MRTGLGGTKGFSGGPLFFLLPFFFFLSSLFFFFFFQKGKKWSRTLCGTSFLQVMGVKVQEWLVLTSALEVWVLTERRLEKYSV